MLSNGNDSGLVIRRRVNRSHAVNTSGKTIGNSNLHIALRVGRSVDTLEERELGRVGGRGLRKRGDLLDNDVRVTNDVAVVADLLRCRVVVALCIDEVAHLQVLDGHNNRECLVGLDGVEVLRVRELG